MVGPAQQRDRFRGCGKEIVEYMSDSGRRPALTCRISGIVGSKVGVVDAASMAYRSEVGLTRTRIILVGIEIKKP